MCICHVSCVCIALMLCDGTLRHCPQKNAVMFYFSILPLPVDLAILIREARAAIADLIPRGRERLPYSYL